VSDDGIIRALVGMGEVYREHDTKLSREVAIEVLLAALAPDRLARFERKAKVLAAMNHPSSALFHGLKITATSVCATSEGFRRSTHYRSDYQKVTETRVKPLAKLCPSSSYSS
jgi:serine/threonine protein kinase